MMISGEANDIWQGDTFLVIRSSYSKDKMGELSSFQVDECEQSLYYNI